MTRFHIQIIRFQTLVSYLLRKFTLTNYGSRLQISSFVYVCKKIVRVERKSPSPTVFQIVLWLDLLLTFFFFLNHFTYLTAQVTYQRLQIYNVPDPIYILNNENFIDETLYFQVLFFIKFFLLITVYLLLFPIIFLAINLDRSGKGKITLDNLLIEIYIPVLPDSFEQLRYNLCYCHHHDLFLGEIIDHCRSIVSAFVSH